MKRSVYIVLVIMLSGNMAAGQVEVSHLFEELPVDTIQKRSFDNHNSLKPFIRQANSTDSSSYIKLAGLSDLNYMQQTNAHYKTGAGISVESGVKNWYFRLAGVQGISSFNMPFEPKAFYVGDSVNGGLLYTDIRSRISYTPNHIFNFQAGVDHNFLGEGSRSLLLGDYGKPYPFAQIRTKFWHFEYSVLYQFLNEDNFDRNKFAASHHISFNATDNLNIGIFESVVFQPKDSTLNRGFDVEYLNPFIFYRPQEYALGSSDNVILGLDLSWSWRSHVAYGQLVLDEFYLSEIKAKSGWWANKYGAQLGVKGRFKNWGDWFYRLEYNFIRPYTFSHISDVVNYGNNGYSLGHPYGANFMEILGELKYQKNKWLIKLFSNYFLTGENKDGFNYGTNIYDSYVNRPFEYDHRIGQGTQVNGTNVMLTISYELLKHGKMNVFVENHVRNRYQLARTDFYLVAGIRSMLWNDYRNY